LQEVQNIILRPVYKKPLFNILLLRVSILLQSCQKELIGPKKDGFEKKTKRISKNAEFYDDFRTAGKIAKKCKRNKF